jgi:hypothetical protein
VALRPSAADEYAFSHAGNSTGDYTLTNVNDSGRLIESTLRAALQDFVDEFVDKGADKMVLEAPTPAH